MPLLRLLSSTGDQSFELPEGRTLLVGRGVTSDIAIYDPTISRRHAELTVGADTVEVKDLDSSNGTCINGTRVAEGRLALDDSITFGKVTFRLTTRGSPGAAIQRPAIAAELGPQGGKIVRQLVVSGGLPPGITSRDGPPSGQLRLDATSAQARQALKLQMLLEVSQKLSAELDLDRLLRTVVDTTFEIMTVDRVTIVLLNEETGDLVPTISRSRVGETQAVQVPRSIAEKVLQERVAVVSQNAPADERFRGQSILIQRVRSAMCSPLMASADRVLGLLYVDNLTATNTFTDEDLQFLVAFSGLAAIGIKNSRYAEQIRREAMVRSNFERYFAPNVAADIAQRGEAIGQGGERRPTTVLFSDIRGFTAIAEAMGPDAIARFLSEYFSEMVEVIFEHGGTLDKFIGDAVMALWGSPIAHVDDPDRAVRAAIGMQRAIGRLNERWMAQGRPEIGVGIGINHGEVFAGNIGSHRRLEYTVIGDAVNVAARLCAEAGPGEILVSEQLLKVVRDQLSCDYLPEMALKGKAHTVQVYRVRGIQPQRTSVTTAVPLRPSNR
ncbi:MAG TPA: adenylate/guanylate cyclase domain-containing protein [Gemmatimonadales bacterium]|jgi:adenylate cyclase|nr:adenylate/guanylate cyclase domain-containing protein [Gemmatimonadales bacterium]